MFTLQKTCQNLDGIFMRLRDLIEDDPCVEDFSSVRGGAELSLSHKKLTKRPSLVVDEE